MSFLSKRINEQKQREQEEILARENIARDFDEEEDSTSLSQDSDIIFEGDSLDDILSLPRSGLTPHGYAQELEEDLKTLLMNGLNN